MAVSESGDVVTFHPGDSTILILDGTGSALRSWQAPVAEAHGITLVKDGAAEHVWIADNRRKRQFQIGYEYPTSGRPISGQVVKTDPDGKIVAPLAKPCLPVYRDG